MLVGLNHREPEVHEGRMVAGGRERYRPRPKVQVRDCRASLRRVSPPAVWRARLCVSVEQGAGRGRWNIQRPSKDGLIRRKEQRYTGCFYLEIGFGCWILGVEI